VVQAEAIIAHIMRISYSGWKVITNKMRYDLVWLLDG